MKGLAFLLCLNLLAGSLLPNWDWHELSDMMQLVEHYHNHTSTAEDDSDVINFLFLHYADDKHQNAAEHENLPFHHSHEHNAAGMFFAIAPITTFSVKDFPLVEKSYSLFDFNFISFYSHSIWQPPKI